MGFLGKQNVPFVHLELMRITVALEVVVIALLALLLSYLDHLFVHIAIRVCIAVNYIMCNFIW